MTNHELARAAAESCCASIFIGIGLTDFDTPGKQKTVEDTIARKVSDTYATAMAELAMYEKLFRAALRNVDRAFQTCSENPNPILPDFCKLGEDKFVAVVRLAEKYAQQDAELERLRRQVKIGEESTNVCYYEMGDYYYCEFCGKSHRDERKLVHHPDCPHDAKEST